MLRWDLRISTTIAGMSEQVETAPAPTRAPTRDVAHLIIAIGVVLTICYVAELVLVVILVATLLAFILAPIVDFLGRFRVPRALSSLFAVLIFMGLIYGITYASYNEAVNFVQVFPKYSERIRTTANSMRERAESLNPFRPATEDKNVIKVQPSSPVTELVTRGFSSFSQAAFALTFVPFLIYFMLSWQQHVRSATVMLFRMEHRHTAYVTLGLISRMIRSFMVGNLLIGLFWALTYITEVSIIVQFLIALVGLGVAIDYALLMIFRFRDELREGEDVETALVETMTHAGRSVIVSGSTVAVGLLSLIVIPLPFIRSMGIGGMLIPAVSVIAAITLLPALLATLGTRINSVRVMPKRFVDHGHPEDGAWGRWGRFVLRNPWPVAIVGLAISGTLATIGV